MHISSRILFQYLWNYNMGIYSLAFQCNFSFMSFLTKILQYQFWIINLFSILYYQRFLYNYSGYIILFRGIFILFVLYYTTYLCIEFPLFRRLYFSPFSPRIYRIMRRKAGLAMRNPSFSWSVIREMWSYRN